MQNKNINPLIKAYEKEKCWINWKLEEKDGKFDKIPKRSNGQGNAKPNDPTTWSTFEEVDNAKANYSGIGIMLNDKLLGIDLDHCIVDGKVSEEVATFISLAETYTEVSPSYKGLHLYLALTEPLKLERNKAPRGIGADYEVYTSGRWFTVSGNLWKESHELRTVKPKEAIELIALLGYPWNEKTETKKESGAISNNTIPLSDEELLKRMFASKNGDKIKILYNGDTSKYGDDPSSADLALCSHLAFWSNCDKGQIERLWMNSPLGSREKTHSRKDYRDRVIDKAVESCTQTYSIKKTEEDTEETSVVNSKLNQANVLLEAILSNKNIVLFHDEQKNGYISLEIEGHQEILSLKSKAMKRWVAHQIYTTQRKAPSGEIIKNVLSVLEGKALFEGEEIQLQNRVSWYNNELFYDLTNSNHQVVKINKDGWEVLDKAPIIFKRYPHNKTQVVPSKTGDINLLLNYVNIASPEHRLLLLVFLVSCFVPGIPHAMLVIFGAQGSSKSTLSKLARLLVDPSLIEVASFPHNQKELIQALAHHYFLFFDNVSHINEEESDTLCKAITGGGYTKRELYSDDEDIIYSFMRCIGMNGINLVTTRPDLLERSLLLELERIDSSNRKTENELYQSFFTDLPVILGGVFDVLVKALKIKPEIKIELNHRMADWTLWGCAIAEALGYSKEEFLNAYQNNLTKQNEMLLNDNVVATAIITFMEDQEQWKSTPTILLDKLVSHAMLKDIDTREKYWPKGAGALSRKLNELSTPLKQMGYSITISTNGAERYICIQKMVKKEIVVEPSQVSLYEDLFDTDDIISTKTIPPIEMPF